MASKPDKKEIAQFRKDVEFLEAVYLRKKIAENLNQGKANFGKYVNGRLSPPKEVISSFYAAYKEHLEWHGSESDEISSIVHDRVAPYGIDYSAEIKSVNDRLSAIEEMVKSILLSLGQKEVPPKVPPYKTKAKKSPHGSGGC